MVIARFILGLTTHAAIRYFKGASIVVGLLFITSLAGISKLTFSDDVTRVFKSGSNDYRHYERLSKRYNLSENDLFVSVDAGRKISQSTVDQIFAFSQQAALVEGVAGVSSFIDLLEFGDTTSKSDDDLGTPVFDDAFLHGLVEKGLIRDAYVSKELDTFLIRILLENKSAGQSLPTREHIGEIQAIFDQSFDTHPVDSYWVGTPIIRMSIIDSLISDQLWLNAFGGLAGLVVCIYLLGSWRLAVITCAAPGFATLLLLGFMGLLSISVTVITNVLPLLVMVLGFADAMHLSFEWKRQAQALPEDPKGAIMSVLKRVGPACFLTSATTGVAFASLLLSDSLLIREFAIAGILAVSVVFLVVIMVYPLVLYLGVMSRFLRVSNMPTRTSGPRNLDRWTSHFRHIIDGHAGRIVIFGLVLTIAGTTAYLSSSTRYAFSENLPTSSQVSSAIAQVDKAHGGVQTLDIEVPFDRLNADVLATSIQSLRETHERLADMVSPWRVVSLWSAIRLQGIEEDPDLVVLFQDRISKLTAHDHSRFFPTDGGKTLIRIVIPDLSSKDVRELSKRIEVFLADNYEASPPGGILQVSAFSSEKMINDLKTSLILTGVLAAFIAAAAFRRLDYVFYAIFPNIIPIVIVGGCLAIFNNGLQFSSALALVIGLGIAVDDTIHYLNHLNLIEADTSDDSAAIKALETTGPVLIASSTVLVLGLFATAFSALPTVELFGLVTIGVIVTALLADMLILPATAVIYKSMIRLRGAA